MSMSECGLILLSCVHDKRFVTRQLRFMEAEYSVPMRALSSVGHHRRMTRTWWPGELDAAVAILIQRFTPGSGATSAGFTHWTRPSIS